MPERREISAREIGAPARIASSTVRSFSARRSGGVAWRVSAISARTLTVARHDSYLDTRLAALRRSPCAGSSHDFQTMKLAVIGGGSTYTPELVSGLARERERLDLTDVVL